MRNSAKCLCLMVLLGSIGPGVPQFVDARGRDTVRENGKEGSEKQRELLDKIQKLEEEKKRLEQLRVMQAQRARHNKQKKNMKMVDAAEVWHRCSVEVREIDGKLDKGYIERQFRSYLSGIASMIKKEEKTGRYEIEGTVDAEGNMIALEVTQDSFQSDTLKEKISGLLSRLNYGKSYDGNQAKITLVIMREGV